MIEDVNVEHLEISELDISEFGAPDLRNVKGIQYPCVLLNNVYLSDVLPLLNAIDKDSTRRLPAWVFVQDTFEPIGGLSLTFDTVYLMRQLGVSLTLFADADNVESLNLKNNAVMERFI